MRKELKNLWDEIINPNNKKNMFDLMSLMLLMFNGEIPPDEYIELREYAEATL